MPVAQETVTQAGHDSALRSQSSSASLEAVPERKDTVDDAVNGDSMPASRSRHEECENSSGISDATFQLPNAEDVPGIAKAKRQKSQESPESTVHGTSRDGSRSASPADSRRESRESKAATTVTTIRVPAIVEENSSEGQKAAPEASHDLSRALDECWRLCITLCELTAEVRKQLFAKDISAEESETTWNLCWSLCQSTFMAHHHDKIRSGSHLRMQTRIARDLFNALLVIRSGNDRLSSLLQATSALNNHLHSGLPVDLPPAYDERTLNLYFELCTQLLDSTTSLTQAFLTQLQACWALTSALHILRRHQAQSRLTSEADKQEENELLNIALDSCFNLCAILYDAHSRSNHNSRPTASPGLDTDLGPTSRASQVSFSTYPVRPGLSSVFPSMDSAMFSPRTLPPPKPSTAAAKFSVATLPSGFRHPFTPATTGIISASVPDKSTHSHHNSGSKPTAKSKQTAAAPTARIPPPTRPTSAPAAHPVTPPNQASTSFPETPLTVFSDLDQDPMEELERAEPPSIVVLSKQGSLGGESVEHLPRVGEIGSRASSLAPDRREGTHERKHSGRHGRLR